MTETDDVPCLCALLQAAPGKEIALKAIEVLMERDAQAVAPTVDLLTKGLVLVEKAPDRYDIANVLKTSDRFRGSGVASARHIRRLIATAGTATADGLLRSARSLTVHGGLADDQDVGGHRGVRLRVDAALLHELARAWART